MAPLKVKEFTEIQLSLLQMKINKFEQVQPVSPKFFRESWSIVSSLNRQIEDEHVKKNLAVLKESPGKYYFGDDRLPFTLFRLEKMFTIYSAKGWDLTIDDLNLNLFDIEEVLDNVRLELDMLIDYMISTYDLNLRRTVFSLFRKKPSASLTADALRDDPTLPPKATDGGT